MKKTDISTLLKHNELFVSLSEEQLARLLVDTKTISVPKDSFLIREGEKEEKMFLILKGRMGILKKDPISGILHQFATIFPGEIVGEISLLDKEARSSFVQALEDSIVLVFLIQDLLALAKEQEVYAQLLLNISKIMARRIRQTDEITVRSLQTEIDSQKVRIEMEKFLFLILIILSSWVFIVNLLARYAAELQFHTLISIPIIIAIIIVSIRHIKTSLYKISFFGLTLKNWKRNFVESVLFTIPFLILFVIIKWALITYVPAFENLGLIRREFIKSSSPIAPSIQILIPFLYITFIALQELIARGVLQSSIKAALSGKHTTFWSIILASLVFASFHAHISPDFAAAAFLCGLFWGWIYARQGSLVGPTVSHTLIGIALLLLDGDKILVGY